MNVAKKASGSLKGQAAVAVVVIMLVVVGIVVLFMYSGFGIQPVIYSNDVITVTNKFVSDKAPYDGQKTTIEFTINNNGKGPINDVKLLLEPPTGFTSEVRCGDSSGSTSTTYQGGSGGGICTFNMEEGDAIDILIILTAEERVTQIIPTTVRYSISYLYSGEREAHIPIISDRDSLPRGQSFFVSSQTFGPLQISVSQPQSRQVSTGESAIFAVSGIPFRLDFSVSDVGGGFFGSKNPVVLKGGQMSLELTNVKTLFCDKIDPSTNKLKDIGGGVQDEFSGEEVPFDVSCRFEGTAEEGSGLTDGVIKINLENYEYKISMSDGFNIRPRNIPDIQSSVSQSQPESSSSSSESGDKTDSKTVGTSSKRSGACPPGGCKDTISVDTEKFSYNSGDEIFITGEVSNVKSGDPVTLQVISGGNVVTIGQTVVDGKGKFSFKVVASGNLWVSPGTYSAKVKYGKLDAEATFKLDDPNSHGK